MTPLPFQPEPLAALKARYHLAVETPVDVESVELGVAADPGRLPKHVFDFADGLRIVARREVGVLGGRYVHFSMVSFPGTKVHRVWRAAASRFGIARANDSLLSKCGVRIRRLSGDRREWVRALDANNVVHWFIMESGRCPIDGSIWK